MNIVINYHQCCLLALALTGQREREQLNKGNNEQYTSAQNPYRSAGRPIIVCVCVSVSGVSE